MKLKTRADNVIPAITDPMGRSWDQPALFEIVVDDTHALMSQDAFNELQEYSASLPTGKYEGKMWKRQAGGVWYLCWFGPHEDPEKLTIHCRTILVAQDLSHLVARHLEEPA